MAWAVQNGVLPLGKRSFLVAFALTALTLTSPAFGRGDRRRRALRFGDVELVEVVFHIGAHKCATTSVQRGLAAHAARDASLAYVPPARPQSPNDEAIAEPALKSLIRLVGREAAPWPERQHVIDGLCRMIEAKAGARRVIISDEYMLGPMPGLGWRFYPRADELRAVLDGVAERFPTSVFLQSRESASFLLSCWRFRVRFGMTVGYEEFLERFDLGSVSWARLGRTLFDGAAYRRRVLPFETLIDPARAPETAEALRFLVPEWDVAATPLSAVNPSNGPLMRAATLILQRAGVRIPTPPRGRPAQLLTAIEAEVAAAGAEAGADLIRRTLGRVRIQIDVELARTVFDAFMEERSEHPSQAGPRARFAPDYAAFLASYAPAP